MKTPLTFKERLLIPTLLKQTGSYKNLMVAQDLTQKIRITQKEWQDAGFKEEGGGIIWNFKKEPKANTYELTELELEAIKTGLSDLDKAEKLTPELLPLYTKFLN